MSTEQISHSEPALVNFPAAVKALHDGFVAVRLAWPHGSAMVHRGGPGLSGTLYVITAGGYAVHLTDADRAASDWIIKEAED